MRLTLWPGYRLTLWEQQNPEAVKVVMPFTKPSRVQRVLSARGWMLLLVQYDWKRRDRPDPDAAQERYARYVVQELHRRSTHLEALTEGGSLRLRTSGEVAALKQVLGIILGGCVHDGSAVRLGERFYVDWLAGDNATSCRCRCDTCDLPAEKPVPAETEALDTPENSAWHTVWLEGRWQWVTSKMTDEQREYAADCVSGYSCYLSQFSADPGEWAEPEDLRWWRN